MTSDVVVYRSGKPWADRWERAFVAGLERSGLRPDVRPESDIRPSDVGVVWAHKNDALFEMQGARGGRYLVMEQGYVGDRGVYCSLGFDGLNGRAEFPEPDPARWDALFDHHLRPWRERGSHALVCGQVPGDASLRGIDINAWARRTRDDAERAFGRARFRPHPGTGGPQRPLTDDLADAAVCITYNSNAAVEAALYGVPVIAMDEGSMARPIAAHDLSIRTPDRRAWCAQLATCQWSREEIETGMAWDRLRGVIE